MLINDFFKLFTEVKHEKSPFISKYSATLSKLPIANFKYINSMQTESQTQEDIKQKLFVEDETSAEGYDIFYSYIQFPIEIGTKSSIHYLKVLTETGEKKPIVYTFQPIQKFLDLKTDLLRLVRDIYTA